MSGYDFSQLNDKEFEDISCDLLSRSLGQRVERFKPGRDGGVDGRFFKSSGEVIVQCKHYLKSGYSQLLSTLKKEVPKLEKLAKDTHISDYIVTTSVPLSRVNKDEIHAIFSDYMSGPENVYGQEDLNDILQDNKDIERKHYKLWLSSTNVFSHIMNYAIVGRSRDYLEDIAERLMFFVKPEYYDVAMGRLEEIKSIVITGNAGVGKTTLAETMCVDLVQQGYELVLISDDIAEAEAVFDENAKQVFYFDDVFGSTYVEAVSERVDSKVVRFINRVRRGENKRFILTSRVNIVNRVLGLSSPLQNIKFDKYLFDITDRALSPLEKAQILYNKLWHGDLSPAFCEEIVKKRRYLQIVKHHSYNPRIIDHVTDRYVLRGTSVDNYFKLVLATLSNPAVVWEHPFKNQITTDSRAMLMLIATNKHRNGYPESKLKEMFRDLVCQNESNLICTERYVVAVEDVLNSFIVRAFVDEECYYSFADPSVSDFMYGYFYLNQDLFKCAMVAAQNPESILLLDSMVKRSKISLDIAKDLCINFVSQSNCTDQMWINVLDVCQNFNCESEVVSKSRVINFESYFDKFKYKRYVNAFVLIARHELCQSDVIQNKTMDLLSKVNDFDELALFSNIVHVIDDTHVNSSFFANFEELMDVFYDEVVYSEVLSEYYTDDDIDAAECALDSFVDNLLNSFAIDVSHYREGLVSSIDVGDIINENLVAVSRGGGFESSVSADYSIVIDLFEN